MKVIVLGTGYVGLVQGACLAHLGHDVWCVDINPARVASLARGEVPFFEQDLPELVGQGIARGALRFTTSLSEAVSGDRPHVAFICVQTPHGQDGTCDLSYIEQASRELGAVIDSQTVVVVKSTVPPGTNAKVAAWLAKEGVEVASNPEFLREGSAVKDFLRPDRMVFGTRSERVRTLLTELHAGIAAPIYFVSPETAQLAKYAANTMLASRLSLINEIANIADHLGADIKDIERIVGSDPRIGAQFLRSGAGFGGSCFPKDVLALEQSAREHGYTPRLIQPIIELNRDQPLRFVDLAKRRLGGLVGKRIAVWGLAFNKNTDDVRESPALVIARKLIAAGALVSVYDPRAMESARFALGDAVAYAPSAMDALTGADALMVLTEWEEFLQVPWEQVRERLRTPIIFDGKNFLPHQALREKGFFVHGIGLCQPSDLR